MTGDALEGLLRRVAVLSAEERRLVAALMRSSPDGPLPVRPLLLALADVLDEARQEGRGVTAAAHDAADAPAPPAFVLRPGRPA